MKKLFALMLALCLMLGCAALADNDIAWDQIAPMLEEKGITGEFVTVDEAAKEVLHNGYYEVEYDPEYVTLTGFDSDIVQVLQSQRHTVYDGFHAICIRRFLDVFPVIICVGI